MVYFALTFANIGRQYQYLVTESITKASSQLPACFCSEIMFYIHRRDIYDKFSVFCTGISVNSTFSGSL
jgi:hypothetical protein